MKTHPATGNETDENSKSIHARQKSGQTHNRTPSLFSRKSQMQISPEPYLYGSKIPLSGGGAALNESEYQNFDVNTHRVAEENISSPRFEGKQSLMKFFENDEPKTFEDGSLSKVKFQRFQVMDMSTGIIALIGAFLTIMAYDLEFEQRDTKLLKALLWTIFGSTIIAIFLNVFTLLERIEYLKAKKLLESSANLKNTGGLWLLLIETFTLLLQPYPFTRDIRIDLTNVFENNLSYYYDLNDLLSLLIVLRVYIILRFIINTTLYRSPRAQRITQMYGTTNDYLFACRCLTKKNPSVVVTLSFGLSIFIFGYLLRICEKPLNRDLELGLNDFNSYWNSMWCVVVTMTVVGYGDYYPRTLFGKITTLLVCLWGVFVVSLIVVTLTNILSMESGQEHVLTVLQRLELRSELEKEAAYVLTNMAKIRLTNKRVKDVNLKKKLNHQNTAKLKSHMQNMKRIDRTLRGVNHSKIKDDMTRHFLLLRNEVKDVAQEQNDLLETIKNLKQVLEAN